MLIATSGYWCPADPVLGAVALLLESSEDATLDIELWTVDRGENHIPVRRLRSTRLSVQPGRRWSRVEFDYVGDAPEDLVVLVRRHEAVSVIVENSPAPYGVMGLVSRQPRFTAELNGEHPQTNAWSADELRRRSVAIRIEPDTAAYAVEHVQGGYARPFGGPQLWSSELLVDGRDEAVTLRWDAAQSIGSVELVFNDDVDTDLVNLHHHRTPFVVIPELVRDYRIEAETAVGWQDGRGRDRQPGAAPQAPVRCSSDRLSAPPRDRGDQRLGLGHRAWHPGLRARHPDSPTPHASGRSADRRRLSWWSFRSSPASKESGSRWATSIQSSPVVSESLIRPPK